MKPIFTTARRLKRAALGTGALAIALALAGCAHRPPLAVPDDTVSVLISKAAIEENANLRRGLCFRPSKICLPPIPLPVWQEPLLTRQVTLTPPAGKAEPLPVSKICTLRHQPAKDGTLQTTETCVLLFGP